MPPGDDEIELRNMLYEPPGTELHYDGVRSTATSRDGSVPGASISGPTPRPGNRRSPGLSGTIPDPASVAHIQPRKGPRAMTPDELRQLANEMLDQTHAQSAMLNHNALDHAAGNPDNGFNTDPKGGFAEWKRRNAPNDSGADYDLAGAYNAGESPGPDGHWTDQFKKPNHPTFSNESQYAGYEPGKAGSWDQGAEDGSSNYLPKGDHRWLDEYMAREEGSDGDK